ncbi:hypothetical protein EGW08_011039 [Elysia chlorotica]|uniref:DUF4371 domain-containing protein n=1 Tax=Elysia chlorotica TaxID=188477 RepID=A0A433THY0_ELYCH|nr:hypothetical protein EGW08_011039 [Elysia chlorotica]
MQVCHDTAKFVKFVLNWWNTVNVSAKGQDIRLKDPHRAVQDSSSTSLGVYATHFGQDDSGHGKTRVQCLTHDTKKALVQTMQGLSAVARAEALFTAFITEHNLPLAVADHAGELFRKMFPDSAIAKKYRCARTKTRGLVGVLAKEGKQETVSVLKDGRPFSLSTDGSNDKEGNSTGEEIFLALDRELQASGLDWGSCISFGSDNASVMLGRLSGVATFIKEKNRQVHIQGCPCHLLHIAAKNGAACLRYPVEEWLVDIFYYLENSSKRMKAFSSFKLETGCAHKKILKHGSTGGSVCSTQSLVYLSSGMPWWNFSRQKWKL